MHAWSIMHYIEVNPTLMEVIHHYYYPPIFSSIASAKYHTPLSYFTDERISLVAKIVVHRGIIIQSQHQAVFSFTSIRLIRCPFGYGSSGKPRPHGAVAVLGEDLASDPEEFLDPGLCWGKRRSFG